MKVLAGDVGGTKTLLGLFDVDGDHCDAIATVELRSADHASLAALAHAFVAGLPAHPVRAAFGIPGPVLGRQARTTNLPWWVDAAELEAALGIPEVTLLNDLEATALGIATLPPDRIETLHPGAADSSGNAALIAPGTGLGECGLYWDGKAHHPFATEGGHATFAPRTDVERGLAASLAARLGHVSWERVCSGPGLAAIHEHLRARAEAVIPDWLAAERASDPAAAISRAALTGRDPVCASALGLFTELLGAEAGNLGLKMLATGGVYLGGGMLPRIAAAVRGPRFLDAFLSKGRMRALMERMPVRLILDPTTALRGAALRAAAPATPRG